MRHFIALSVVVALTAGCGGDTGVGTGQSPARDGGQTGGTSNAGGGASGSGGASGNGGLVTTGGAPGTQCRTNADCPALGCYMCGSFCMNGRCITTVGPGAGGAIGTGGSAAGGSSGALQWYRTCGPPVCQAPLPGSGGTSSGLPRCATTEVPGAPCPTAGTECDDGAACSGPLLCAASDPTHGGNCPISRAKFKTDIEYVSSAEREKLAEDVQSMPLVRYRYKDAPEREHLGFIIEDIEPSPGVDSANDRVDLYGYASMAVAAIQEQHREIEALKRELAELRAEVARGRSGKAKTHR